MPRHATRSRATALLLAVSLTGCSLGPAVVQHDQLGYAAALSEAGKRQTLLNVVKLRYADVPTFVSVNQLVSAYTMQGGIGLGSNIFTDAIRLGEDVSIGVNGSFSNTPTITYTPIRGREFARLLLAPLEPGELFGLLLAGVPAELVLGLGIHSLGNLRNEKSGATGSVPAHPQFIEAAGLTGQLLDAGLLSVRIEPNGIASRVHLLFEGGTGNGTVDPREARLRKLLGLDAESREFKVAYAMGEPTPGVVNIRTRSLVEVLGQLAADVAVPSSDVEEGRTYAMRSQPRPPMQPQITVENGFFAPSDAYVRVDYNGRWFWIANDDLPSKRIFSFVMLLFSLAQQTRPGQGPIITIPAS
ncbi:hypothetical protein [Marinimicrococcus flavescens]|uniref:Uncharacterized protein n=1 Tax=Marinimicrococcus flavescens TaxID=3031815 RepID=A0AAP3XQJ8_9PROT|nr:hypothetical protein [Marinimicrococcus flavescens]